MSPERKKLKDFIETHFSFKDLKKVGFFDKNVRSTDYEKIAERVCYFFEYDSIYEYETLDDEIDHRPEANVITGKIRDKVNEKGELVPGGGYHLSMASLPDFECPICTCKQEARESNKMYSTQKCKGCKRKLVIVHDMDGNFKVSEKVLPGPKATDSNSKDGNKKL